MDVVESPRTEPRSLRARKKIEGFALKRAVLVVDDDVTMRALVSFVLATPATAWWRPRRDGTRSNASPDTDASCREGASHSARS